MTNLYSCLFAQAMTIHMLLLLPPVPPEELSTSTETNNTQANMGTLITEAQLQAIVIAAIRTANGDKKNLKTLNKMCSLAKLKILQTFYKNANLGSKFSPPHTSMQPKRFSMPFL